MIFAVIFLLGGANAADIDVLAQAKSGKMVCVNPDAATKTCSSISSYSVSADGSVIETTEVLLAPDQPLTLTMSIRTKVDGGLICGVMTLEDLKHGVVRMNDDAIPSDRNADFLQRLEASMGSLTGREVCDALRIEDNGLVKYGQVERIDLKLPGKPVIWVSSGDGFKVAPR